jgi:hypothetical protein
VPGYDLSNSQISPVIFSKRLEDKDFAEYSCIEFLAFELQLNISIRCFFVHFPDEKPGDKTYCSGEYQNSSPVESITLIIVSPSVGSEDMQLLANCLMLNEEYNFLEEITITGYFGFRNMILNSI